MSTLRNLTGKRVHIGIKNGMSVQDFCQKYECNPEELQERLGRLFTVKDNARQVWNEILANEKKPKAKVVVEEAVDTVPDVADEVTEDEEVDTTPHVPTMDELKASEGLYSDAVIELEKAYKACFQEREKGRDEYRRLRDDISELKRAYESKGHEVEKIIQRDHELVDRMNEIYTVYRGKRAALEAIRSQIEELSKIVICVYSSREIAPFDETVEINLDDTGHDELFSHLREQEEAEDFRPKDVRTVARLIRIVANLGSPVEIIFEDEEVKKAYEVFAKSA